METAPPQFLARARSRNPFFRGHPKKYHNSVAAFAAQFRLHQRKETER